MTYEELVARSRSLPYSIPTEANRLERLAAPREEVEAHAAGVRPILHPSLPTLLDELLAVKAASGADVERSLYAGMDRATFISRLLVNRPLSFLNPSDSFLLADGQQGHGGFDRIGTDREAPPLTLDRLISYDEMQVAALLGVSVPTHFINSGARGNRARPGEPGTYEPKGVYVGLVGARFERPGLMESQHMLVTPRQNTVERGYGPDGRDPRLAVWARFYGLDHFPLHAEATEDTGDRYLPLPSGGYLDGRVYRRRIRVSAEALLLEAEERGLAEDRPVYVHVVGLGLGVWGVHPLQAQLSVEAYAQVIRERSLPHVADVDFSWFGSVGSCGGTPDGGILREGGNAVRVHFSRREPAARLTGRDQDKLLVASYAWDGNAFPGNEYWMGSLAASGDPAAACCSNIPELQNPHVNPRVSGEHALVLGVG